MSLNVNPTDWTMLIGDKPLINTVCVKQMHAWKTSKIRKTTIKNLNLKKKTNNDSYLTSCSISNCDKQIVHFSSSSVALLRRILLYLCGKVFLSITSRVAPRPDPIKRLVVSKTRTNWLRLDNKFVSLSLTFNTKIKN